MSYTPSIGRIVHYVLPSTSRRAGEVRPAIIVRALRPMIDPTDPGMCNLHVVLDGPNDAGTSEWAGSVLYSAGREPDTWHWPERV